MEKRKHGSQSPNFRKNICEGQVRPFQTSSIPRFYKMIVRIFGETFYFLLGIMKLQREEKI